MADGGVKAEVKPEIKLDPGEDGTRNMNDIDAFEDDTDLKIPPGVMRGGPSAWLVKIPKDMWEAWSKAYADAPDYDMVEIGKMRVYKDVPDENMLNQKIQIRLNEQTPHTLDLPKKYELKLSTAAYNNTCVFSEKDLPGHKPSAIGRNRHLQPGAKPSGIQSKGERYGQNGQAGASGKPNYRTAIPKETALLPQIQHEANAAPIEDDEYFAHIAKRWKEHVAPKSRTTYIEGIDRGMHPGVSSAASLGAFGLSSKPKAGKKKAVKEKAVRLERSQLMDALGQCFRRYRYCSMRFLRNELKQPEAWIKENLEQIATLVRSGDFAMNWVLKPEFQSTIVKDDDEVKEEVAKVESGAEESGSGDEMDEDGDDFEDVKMEGS
ncbi:hypothetical protein KC361_g3924 [Hortaea werneckii]|nr:hypothetical protein KC361_g3924 [Hortaea werneckii]KAI7510797.1 hypothetical protein KC347_g3964 [Hortaea werneckii]